MFDISLTYTKRYYLWTDWLAERTKRGAAPQFDDGIGDYYLIYFYDGPEFFWCRIWKGIIPADISAAEGYSQAQNDADKIALLALAPGYNQPIETAIGGSDGANLQAIRVFDADTGAGSEFVLGAILRASGAGGTVEAGTLASPLRTDPTGTTTQPMSATALPLPTGASTSANQTTIGSQTTKINDGTNTAAVTAASALKVDGAAVTQPVSAAALPLPVGAATEVTLAARLAEATFTARVNTQGQKTMATSTPVVIASDQSAVPISGTNTTATGVLGALNATVVVAIAGQQSVGFQLDAGTLVGTLVAELSFDGGLTYNPALMTDQIPNAIANLMFIAANTAEGRTIAMQGGATHARVRVSAYTGGTANLTIGATQACDSGMNDTLFQRLTFQKKGYAFAVETSIALAAETNWIYFSNTSTNRLMRIFEQVVSIPQAANTVRSTLKIYVGNSAVVGGTPLVIGSLRTGSVPSVISGVTLPTSITRGTLVQVYGVINAPTIRQLDLTRYLEPGGNLLITVQPSATSTIHGFTQDWAEVSL